MVGSVLARKSAKILSARLGAVGYGSRRTSGCFSKTRNSTRVAELSRYAPIRLERSAGAWDRPLRRWGCATDSHCCFQNS
jgi:hypothetical protein